MNHCWIRGRVWKDLQLFNCRILLTFMQTLYGGLMWFPDKLKDIYICIVSDSDSLFPMDL